MSASPNNHNTGAQPKKVHRFPHRRIPKQDTCVNNTDKLLQLIGSIPQNASRDPGKLKRYCTDSAWDQYTKVFEKLNDWFSDLEQSKSSKVSTRQLLQKFLHPREKKAVSDRTVSLLYQFFQESLKFLYCTETTHVETLKVQIHTVRINFYLLRELVSAKACAEIQSVFTAWDNAALQQSPNQRPRGLTPPVPIKKDDAAAVESNLLVVETVTPTTTPPAKVPQHIVERWAAAPACYIKPIVARTAGTEYLQYTHCHVRNPTYSTAFPLPLQEL